MNARFRVGIIQYNPLVGDVSGNADRIAQAYTELCEAEPEIVVTPELSLLGYPPRDLLHRQGVLDRQATALERLASKTADGPPLVVGAATQTGRAAGAPLYNSAVVLRDGKQTATYHKRLLPTYDVFDEHRYFRPGTETTVVTVDGVDVGLTVCEDAWNDAVVTGKRRHETAPLEEASDCGADLLVTISASPFSLDKPARREQRFAGHAASANCPVVFANQVGGNDELLFDGHSFVAADGTVLDRFAGFEPETAVVDIPLDGAVEDTPQAYDQPPASQLRQALGLGIRDYFTKTGFQEAIIGLSGGIDSAVTATLAADALGPENVYGVSLPSTITSEQSITDAQRVAENLGIAFDVVPVSPVVEAVGQVLDEHAETLTGIAAENIQARIRGDILMGLANERDALVLTPDNKSEAAVGYCTLYGDTVGALAPLGDCYKRLVYDLAAAFNNAPPTATSSPVIPESVIEKAPTAELRDGQTDTDELPAYEQLDPVLEAYIEGRRDGGQLREEYPAAVVETAVSRITRSEFKRRQTPPPLRVTQKALGRGWAYPVAASYDHVIDSE